jgi:hypothetical protein
MRLSDFLVGLDVILRHHDPEKLQILGAYTENVYISRIDGLPLEIPEDDGTKLVKMGWAPDCGVCSGAWVACCW